MPQKLDGIYELLYVKSRRSMRWNKERDHITYGYVNIVEKNPITLIETGKHDA